MKEKRHINDVTYSELKLQPYLQDVRFSKEERKLLTSLRSRCYNAKIYFIKLHRNALNCRLGCDSDETQFHILTQCTYIEIPPNIEYSHIFKSATLQEEVIQLFLDIDKRRLKLLENVPPGESRARAQES